MPRLVGIKARHGAFTMLLAGAFDVRIEDEFARIVSCDATLRKLASGFRFLEGPVWNRGSLLFSDIPANRMHKWSADGGISLFREPSGHANGNTVDRDGRLVTCEHATRRVTRTEADGTVTVLADMFEGKRFNSPNDVVVKSDGTVWFTDPPYGLPRGAAREQAGNYVYRLDPRTGDLRVAAMDFVMPNGLCFPPDETRLYIADSGAPHHVRVFDVGADGVLTGGEVFCVIDKGVPDGMRVDAAGRLYSTAGDGVHIYDFEGRLIGTILVPETPANCAFGGEDGQTLFITARSSLYSIRLNTAAP